MDNETSAQEAQAHVDAEIARWIETYAEVPDELMITPRDFSALFLESMIVWYPDGTHKYRGINMNIIDGREGAREAA